MSLTSKIIKCIRNPWHIMHKLIARRYFDWLGDEAFLRLMFRTNMGKRLNLKNPQSFSEKLQWLKLNDHNAEYSRMVDKAEAKDYIIERIGSEYIIPTLGVYDSFDEIDFDALPDQFVIKCTHNSGGLVICKDKSRLDITAAKARINKKLAENYFIHSREWPYKHVKPRIIAEAYMENPDGSDLSDYKLHCFNGKMKMVLVCHDRYGAGGLTEDFFDEDWNHLPIRRPSHPNASVEIPRPQTLDEMIRLAEKLSADVPFLRVDFYEIGGRIYFGELTFFPASGTTPFCPDSWDYTIGSWLTLPKGKSK